MAAMVPRTPPRRPAFTYECTNLNCTFTDQSADDDGQIESRSWDFGDGSSGTGASATHAYANAGDYDVTVEATDDGGLNDTSDPQTVTVTAESATCRRPSMSLVPGSRAC